MGFSPCSPLEHITMDSGHSYQQVENYMMLSGTDKRMVALETEPEKLNRLQNIFDCLPTEAWRNC
jgi:hypothetical protein